MRLAIFSALPQEIRRVVKNTKATRSSEGPVPSFLGKYSSIDVIAALTGMGGGNSETTFLYILKRYRPDLALSIGFGGALYEHAEIGEIVWGSRLFLVRNGIEDTLDLPDSGDVMRRISHAPVMRKGSILTLEGLTRKSLIKKILPPDLPFPVSDMETFFLAKLAVAKGLPFHALRSVTDRADEEIPPEFLAVSDKSGQYRLSRALGLLCKPRLLKDVAKIGRNSFMASNALWHAVRSVMEAL